MALALRKAASLKPEVRLAQAVSEFEASLDAEHKAEFRNTRIAAKAAPPTPSDVMRLTAEIDSRMRHEHGPSRCFGPRLTNILQAVQQFAALGDTVVGGSQNLVACGVWSAVKMMLHMAIGYVSYLEKLSLLFMTAGRQAPRYQALAIIYPQSQTLQRYLSEYFIVIVHICQKIQKYAMKSVFGQFKSSLNDADLKEYQADLEIWGNSIKDEAMLLLNQRIQSESQENKKARALVTMWSSSSTQRQQALERVERKVRQLDLCSTYDFETTWKQIRKRGSTSLPSTWDEYQQWKHKLETPSAILFRGKIGAGKSVILANIVDDLYLSGDAIIVYFFCRHDIPKSLTSRTILGSLTRQYLSHFPENNDAFKRDATSLDLDELVALMEPQRDDRPRYMLIDGLDECSIEEQCSILTQISWLQGQSNWRLGFSARFSAESIITQLINPKWSISLPTNNPDIERYIDSELEARLANGQLKLGDPNLVSEIRAALLKGANGMFLWVALQLDQVCSEVSDHSIRLAIESLPRDLSEMYARILSVSTARDNGQYHIRLFKFLAAAYAPLTIGQIQEMASVTIGVTTWDPSKRVNDISKVLGFCGSLIMIEEEEQAVRFVHHSAKSFCQGDLKGFDHWEFCFSDEEAHCQIGETAVTFLSYGIFDTRLSTNVIPKVDVGGVANRIVQDTFGTAYPLARFALGFVRPTQDVIRDIGPFLSQAQRETTSGDWETMNHPFLPYAKKFWMLHTRNIKSLVAQKLWARLFDEVNICDLQLTSHFLGPLDTFQIPCEHPFAPAFLWAVNHSHVPMFDRLMVLRRTYSFSTKLPWALFRFFRSLLQHLHPQNSLTRPPRLEIAMIRRLLPMAITLKVYRAVEWMLPCVQSQMTLRSSEDEDFYGDYLYKPATSDSPGPAFEHANKLFLPANLLGIAASQDTRMVSLLVKSGAAKSADTNSSILSDLLYSDMHQAPLLRTIFILFNAGIPLKHPILRQTSLAFQLLVISPEINTVMSSLAIRRILTANSNLSELHQTSLRQACSIGSFELAFVTWASHVECNTHIAAWGRTCKFPFVGNELDVTLQTVSKNRIKLANWLVENGAHRGDKRILRRAIILRNWQLADALLIEEYLLRDALTFCANHELLHFCTLAGDLAGIDFLLKIGMNFTTPSVGPIFKPQTPLQALVEAQDSDAFVHLSIARLFMRQAFPSTIVSHGCNYMGMVRDVERLISPDNHSTWSLNIQSTMKGLAANETYPYGQGWVICLFSVFIRKVVQKHFVPLNGDTSTGLGHLKNWLRLFEEMFTMKKPIACEEQEGILAIREIFGATADLNGKTVAAEAAAAQLSSRYRWEAQMRLWQFIELLITRAPPESVTHMDRNRVLQELFTWSRGRLFPDDSLDPSSMESWCHKLRPLGGRGLAWTLQYLHMSSRHFSTDDFCRLSESWTLNGKDVNVSAQIRKALKLLGWHEQDLYCLREHIG